jgi:hypothetical protein
MRENDHWSGDNDDNNDQLLIENDHFVNDNVHFLTDYDDFILKMIVVWLKTIVF